MTALPQISTKSAWSRIAALSRAEWRQMKRNPLLMSGVPLPTLAAVFMLLLFDTGPVGVAFASDFFMLFAPIFLVYYTVLVATATRRDENVLKRLRTGEARDWEILTSIGVPAGMLTLVFAPVTVAAVYYFADEGAADVHSWPLMLLIIVLAILFYHGAGLLTSIFTKDVEASFVTSAPVILLAMFSMPNLQSFFPDNAQEVISWTPMNLYIVLFRVGWTGAEIDALAAKIVVAVAWTLAAIYCGYRFMVWEKRR